MLNTCNILDMKIKIILASFAVLLLSACSAKSESNVAETSDEGTVVTQNPADPSNAGYYIDGIVYTLSNGILDQQIEDSTTFNKFKLLEFKASGDINQDSVDDSAVILINDAGGSGTFYYLGILTSGPTPIIENTSFLGDRIEVKEINFVDGNFEVVYLDRDVETSFDQPPTIEITGIAELDENKTGFNFSCRDSVGICF
jgi:hypothetical protein